ncbi:MAG: hypothetical protein ACLR23_23400 [Clostridia bacterium]
MAYWSISSINGDERAFVYIILIGKEPVRCVAEIKLFIAGRLQLHLLCILAHGDGNEFEGCVNLLLHDGTCLVKYFFVVVVGVAQGIPDQIYLSGSGAVAWLFSALLFAWELFSWELLGCELFS